MQTREQRNERNRNYMINYRLTHKEQRNKYNHKNKELALNLIGNKCVICSSTERLIFHEIHGKPHNSCDPFYYVNRYKNFIPLCYRHHIFIHFLDDTTDIELFKVLLLVEQLKTRL